jgi:hypothetical protein
LGFACISQAEKGFGVQRFAFAAGLVAKSLFLLTKMEETL